MPTIAKIDETGAVVGERQLRRPVELEAIFPSCTRWYRRSWPLTGRYQGGQEPRRSVRSGTNPGARRERARARGGSSRLPHWRAGAWRSHPNRETGASR